MVHVQPGSETITCTTEHPFYIQRKGWVAAQDLKPNDKLELRDGEDAFVDAVRYEKLDKPIPVFNFEVEGFHTYFVGTSCVLVHNMCSKDTTKIAKDLGYSKPKQYSSGKQIYYNPKASRNMQYISCDRTTHKGGCWKAARSIKDLKNRTTRTGTYSIDLKERIDD